MMKKEGFALLLLVAVLVGSALNLRYLKGLSGTLSQQVESVSSAAEQGDWETAENLALASMDLWTGTDKYTHIFIRHGEIDAITDDYCTLLGAIRNQDIGVLSTARLMLLNRFASLYEMERFKAGSIL